MPPIAAVLATPTEDQTLADGDQTLADLDQAGSDGDQIVADREQAAADSDQAASDRDLVHGGDPGTHDASRDIRSRGAQQRKYSAQGRVDAASARDQVAHQRDLRALARDRAAELRDRAFATQDAAGVDDASKIMRRAARTRRSAADARAAAAEGRAQAAADRKQAAGDRELAARNARQAQADRDALLEELAAAKTDGLTGTRSRATGLGDLDHEIARARRTKGPLVIAYVDVVGLKAVNDDQGRAAGDALLQTVVNAIRGHLRSHDLIVRIGGDEFFCVMFGATIEDALQRFGIIQTAARCEINVGFAALASDDSAAELIERVDSELLTRGWR